MKQLFFHIGRFFGLFSTETLDFKVRAAFMYLRAGFFAKRFRSFGKHILIGGHTQLRGCHHISLGNEVKICRNTVLTAWDRYGNQRFTPQITVGDGTHFGDGCHITAINNITIGRNVLFGKYVLVTDNNHGTRAESGSLPPTDRPLVSKGPVVIGDNVWIGEHACIMPGVTIGRNAIIAAGSIVTHDVQPDTAVAGNPAKPIR